MPNVDLATGLLIKGEFFRLLTDEVAAAAREGQPFAVLAVVPQHFPDEDMTDAIRVAAVCVRKVIRDNDLAGYVDDDIVAIGLCGCDRTGAAILSQRLQGDLRLCSAHIQSIIWEVGSAGLPEDGTTADELLAAAIDAARMRRRRLAAL
jgi:GGDEF domain-containing protein